MGSARGASVREKNITTLGSHFVSRCKPCLTVSLQPCPQARSLRAAPQSGSEVSRGGQDLIQESRLGV